MTEHQLHEVFLSHNKMDKLAVEKLASRLTDEAGLKVWLDEWNLVPGDPWQEAIENALDRSKACAIFIGPSGLGPWHHEEMRAALQRRVEQQSFRVIPVLLPGATLPQRGQLPLFLSRLEWVDFRGEKELENDKIFHRLVCGIRGIEPGRGSTLFTTTVECPYRGLEVFDEQHARFFFGREAITQHLLEELRKTRFLCVLGPSGSGKSSLARAGLMPQLRAGRLPSSHLWHYVVFRPGKHPIEELALNLASLEKRSDQISGAYNLINNLRLLEVALHLFAKSFMRAEPEEVRLFILIDQLEEIFTLCRNDHERAQFIKVIRYAATVDNGRVVIVPTMRADFLGRAAELADLAELLSMNQFIVNPMDKGSLRQVIESPAQVVGLRFEPWLVERILKDAGDEPGALPLLEHALLQLFEKRSEDLLQTQTYEQSGGVQGALTKKAEAIFERLTFERQVILRRVMLRLAQPGEGTLDTRRRASKSEMCRRGEKRGAIEEIIDILTNERLLITSRGASGEEQLDVAHEALIRGWPRLGRWINEDRQGLRLHHRLTEDSSEWQSKGKDESYLYKATRLAQADEWRQENDEELNDLEREFLEASSACEFRLAEEQRARQLRELKRTRIFAGVLAVAFIGAITLAVLAYIGQKRAREEERISRQLLYAGSMNLAWRAFEEGNSPHGYQLLDVFLPSSGATTFADLRSFDWYFLWRLTHKERATLKGHNYSVNSVAVSPDGHVIASASSDNTIRIWDANSLLLITILAGHTADVTSLTFSPDGRTLASASRDKTVKLWNVTSHQLLSSLTGHDKEVTSVAFSPDGRTVASAGWDETIKLWDVNSHQLLTSLAGDKVGIMSIAFSPDGRTLASAGRDKTIKLWDVRSHQLSASFIGSEDSVNSVAFSPDGSMLVSAGGDYVTHRDQSVKLWNTSNHQLLATLTGHKEAVSSVAFSPNGHMLASASSDGAIKLWDTGNHQLLNSLMGHENAVNSITFSPDSCTLISGSWDKTIKLWDVCNQQKSDLLTGHEEAVHSVAFSPDGRTLASGSWDKTIKLWDVGTRQLLASLTGHGNKVNSVAFSPDGRTLASSSGDIVSNSFDYSTHDNSIRLWDLNSRQLLDASMGHGEQVNSVAFSPDGRTLASASGNPFGPDSGDVLARFTRYKRLILWDVRSRKELASLPGNEASVNSVAFSPSGRMLAAAEGYFFTGLDNTIKLWDLQSRRLIASLTGHTEIVTSVVFSPDGSMIASASADKTIRLWDTSTHDLLATLYGHKDSIWSVAFSPDSRTLASGSRDGTVRLWDVRSRQLVATLTGHKNSVQSVAFSPDGRTLASGSGDKTIKLWVAATDAEVEAQRSLP